MRGHIRKRGDGYSVVIDIGIDETGKRKQKWHSGYKTKKDAEKAMVKLISDIEKGEYVNPSSIKLGQFLDEWLEDSKKPILAPKTYELYEAIIRLYFKPFLGENELSKLTPSILQRYYTHLREQTDLSNTTINYHHKLLRQALDHAVKWLYITKNPCDVVDPPKKNKTEMKAWSVLEAQKAEKIFEDTPIKLHVALALYTGLRKGEICALRWSDFDFTNATCVVKRTAQRVSRKLIFKEPKSEKSNRLVVLQQSLIDLLKQEKKKQLENRLLMGSSYITDFDGHISIHTDGHFLEPGFVSKKFQKILAKHPELPKIRFHDLRHTNASIMLASGIDMKTMSERLGHSKIGITMDLYAHVSVEMQRKAVTKMEEFMK